MQILIAMNPFSYSSVVALGNRLDRLRIVKQLGRIVFGLELLKTG
jgi:hypothetical protein